MYKPYILGFILVGSVKTLMAFNYHDRITCHLYSGLYSTDHLVNQVNFPRAADKHDRSPAN